MSDRFSKDHGPVDAARETTGIYKLGFEKESVMGFLIPGIVVFGGGGLLGLLIWKFL